MGLHETPLLGALEDVRDWIRSGRCMIQDRDTRRVGPLIPTPPQARVFNAWMRQARAGRPIRTIEPKYRRGGVSTIHQVTNRRICSRLALCEALTVGHTQLDTRNIFKIAKINQMFESDGGTPSAASITWPNLSTYECRTGAGRGVGRGSGAALLHVTELAELQTTQGLDADAIDALLHTVPDSAHTIIGIEGTGKGPHGELHRLVMEAARGRGQFELCFLPWHEDPRNSLTKEQFERLMDAGEIPALVGSD